MILNVATRQALTRVYDRCGTKVNLLARKKGYVSLYICSYCGRKRREVNNFRFTMLCTFINTYQDLSVGTKILIRVILGECRMESNQSFQFLLLS